MNKHEKALLDIKILTKRMDISIQGNEIQVRVNEKTSSVDLERLEKAVKSLGAKQVQELILFLDSKKA